MKKLMMIVSLALGIAILSGCAGIFNGKTQIVQIDSNVKDANIEMILKDGSIVAVGKTPFTGPIPRNKNPILVLKKEGYGDKKHVLDTKLSLVFFLNGFGSYFSTSSTTTDMSSGAAWEYAPSNIYVNLEPNKASSIEFQKDSDIKRFVMMNYSQLVTDLSRSQGEYLDALVLEQFGAPRADYAKITVELRRLLSESGRSVPTFGEKVAAYYFAS